MEFNLDFALEDILDLPKRISFAKDERYLASHLQSFQKKGRPLVLHPQMAMLEYGALVESGLYMFKDESNGAEFVLVNTDAGKGWFGGQKTNVVLFGGREGKFGVMLRFKTVSLAMMSLAHLYNFGEFGPFGDPIKSYP